MKFADSVAKKFDGDDAGREKQVESSNMPRIVSTDSC